MKETRRLDVLAIVGIILVVVVIGGSVCTSLSLSRYANSPVELREHVLRNLPDNDIRADLEVLNVWPWSKEAYPVWEALDKKAGGDYTKVVDKMDAAERRFVVPQVNHAVKRFPNSARLQFRLGTLGEERLRAQALKRVAGMDKRNALPLYLLAASAASSGSFDEAANLLTEGNRRDHVDYYPPEADVSAKNAFEEMVLSSGSVQSPAQLQVRRLAVSIGKHADKLASMGRAAEGLALLDAVEQMGWRLMHAKCANIMDVMYGSAVISICHKHQRQIYTLTGDKSGLAMVEREQRRLNYLSGGGRAYFDNSMEELVRRMARFAAFSLPVGAMGAAQALLLFVCLIWLGILALRSRGRAGSEFHPRATGNTFASRMLIARYAILLLALGVITPITVYFESKTSMTSMTSMLTAGTVTSVVSVIILLALICRSYVSYRRNYRQVSQESGRFWRRAPAQEKREIMRRLVGFQGGMIITLAIFGLLICGYTKTTMHAFPWQFERVMGGMRQREIQYTADLVAGKVKVPAKYLREAEQRQQKKTPKSGST